jgi:hypothetical protein
MQGLYGQVVSTESTDSGMLGRGKGVAAVDGEGGGESGLETNTDESDLRDLLLALPSPPGGVPSLAQPVAEKSDLQLDFLVAQPVARALSTDSGGRTETKVPVRAPFSRSPRDNHLRNVRDAAPHKAQMEATLIKMREFCQKEDYDTLHSMHFDWWLFPIDDGGKREWNVHSPKDIELLKSDVDFMKKYHEGLKLTALAWGWDLENKRRLPFGRWTDWDVRLAKMIRSTWLFKDSHRFSSLQAFAEDLLRNEKKTQKKFEYGLRGIDLTEILHMDLVKKEGETDEHEYAVKCSGVMTGVNPFVELNEAGLWLLDKTLNGRG